MSCLKSFILVLTLLILVGCSAILPPATPVPTSIIYPTSHPSTPDTAFANAATPMAIFAQNRQKWATRHITHYRFVLSSSCALCGVAHSGPVTIEVKDGKLVSLVNSKGQPTGRFQRSWEKLASIEALFDEIDSIRKSGNEVASVYYDPDYGYPKSIFAQIPGADDGWFGYDVRYFEILK